MVVRSVFVRSALNYDADLISQETGLQCDDPSRTIQSSKDEADINTIVKKFGLTGKVMTHERPPLLEDFDGIVDYRSLMDIKIAADRSFMSQPAEVRSRFGNDPARFVEFCSDEKNLDDLRKMGLAKPVEPVIVDPPLKVEVVNPAVPGS